MVIEKVPSLTIPIPAVKGHFGSDLITFQSQIRPEDVETVLGHDPRSKGWRRLPPDLRQMYEHLQRVTSKDRRAGVTGYIEDRFAPDAYGIGAFPAICIGMTLPAAFQPVDSASSLLLGILNLDASASNRRLILDGLARLTGTMDLFDERDDFKTIEPPLFTFPVTFYAPREGVLTLDQLGQLFHDFNFRQTKLTAGQAVSLDKSDPYIQLANEIGRSSTITEAGGMEERAASLGAKSTAIVVQRVLLRFVRGACEGRGFQESNLSQVAAPNLTSQSRSSIEKELEGFIGAFAEVMGEERFRDRDSLHLTAPGWQVLGLVFHDMIFRVGDRITPSMYTDMIARLAAIDWSRYNPSWIGMIGEPERDKVTQEFVTDSNGRAKVAISRAGRTTIAEMLQYVREKCGLDELLEELETQTGPAVSSEATLGGSDGFTAIAASDAL